MSWAQPPVEFSNFAYAGNVLDDAGMDRLIALCDAQGEEGGIAQHRVNAEVRRSNIAWVPHTPEFEGLYARIWDIGQGFNSRYYGFDLTGFDSMMQVARYDAARTGGYDWHIDFGPLAQARKLSISLQLSHSADYEGGSLEFDIGTDSAPADRDRGLAIAFPSFIRHRVAPVTKGVRYSLVAWLAGPRFR